MLYRIDLFRMLKLEYKDYLILFKSGNFYLSFDEDAIIMNKVFNYKINNLKSNIKVGFPVNSLNKCLEKLKNLNINFLIIDNNEIIKKQNNDINNFSNYLGGVFEYISINNKIKSINEFIKSMNDNNKKIELIHKIEETIKMYQ